MPDDPLNLLPDDKSHGVEKLAEQISWKDFVVEIMGSILPGIVYTIFLSVLLILAVHAIQTSLETHYFPEVIPKKKLTQTTSPLVFIQISSGSGTNQVQSGQIVPIGPDANVNELEAKTGSIESPLQHPFARSVSGSPLITTLFILFVGWLLGMINLRRQVDEMDRRSLVFIYYANLTEHQQDSWAARNKSEWSYPYGNLGPFLNENGYGHLAWLVYWKPEKEKVTNREELREVDRTLKEKLARFLSGSELLRWILSVFGLGLRSLDNRLVVQDGYSFVGMKNKYYIDALKFRILKHCPRLYPSLLKLEAHVRFLATTWRLAEWLRKFGRVMFWIISGPLYLYALVKYFRPEAIDFTLSHREWVLWLQASGAAFVAMNFATHVIRLARRVLHSSRIRELVLILEAVHIACLHSRPLLLGLEKDFSLKPPEYLQPKGKTFSAIPNLGSEK